MHQTIQSSNSRTIYTPGLPTQCKQSWNRNTPMWRQLYSTAPRFERLHHTGLHGEALHVGPEFSGGATGPTVQHDLHPSRALYSDHVMTHKCTRIENKKGPVYIVIWLSHCWPRMHECRGTQILNVVLIVKIKVSSTRSQASTSEDTSEDDPEINLHHHHDGNHKRRSGL